MLEENILIKPNDSLKTALKKLDKNSHKTILVVNETLKMLGVLTDGDIRRQILKGFSLDSDISDSYNRTPLFVFENDYNDEIIREIFIENKIQLIPVLNTDYKIITYITWDKFFSGHEKKKLVFDDCSDIPVIIMAGGKGTRMEPFTKVLPKPLIPIGDKTILEIIIDEFQLFRIKNFYLTLNYRGEMIEAYLNNIDRDYEINYVWEKDFLGTAGSLKLVEDLISDTFIVSNCDVIVKANYSDVLKYHKSHNAYLTIISSIQHYKIPYGVINYKEGGYVIDITEKPEYSFNINTGVYVLNKECLKYIPSDKYFDMPSLISALIEDSKIVCMYPVNENEYIDIGQWEEYSKAVKRMSMF